MQARPRDALRGLRDEGGAHAVQTNESQTAGKNDTHNNSNYKRTINNTQQSHTKCQHDNYNKNKQSNT